MRPKSKKRPARGGRSRTRRLSGNSKRGTSAANAGPRAAHKNDANITARFHVGARVTDNGDGTWTYVYAVHNLNSHRSAQSFSVPANATISGIGFHDVPAHSGEPYGGDDWTPSVSAGALTWSTEPFAQNANANAIRWGTMYTFWFTANAAPETGTATNGLFRAGDPASIDRCD